MNIKIFSLRLASFFVLLIVLGGLWDTWWHVAIGRESFWVPPHIVLYIGMAGGILLAGYRWFLKKESEWKWPFLSLLLIPLSGPFDEMWHRAYGIENLTSPLVIWSPPHILLITGIIVSIVSLLSILKKESDAEVRTLLRNLLFGALGAVFYVLTIPFLPFGAFHVIDFWGAGFVILPVLLLLLKREVVDSGVGSAMYTAAFFILITGLGTIFNTTIDPEVLIPAHDHAPPWIIIISYMIPAIVLTLLRNQHVVLRATLAGALWGITFFGLSSEFLSPFFQPSQSEVLIAIISSTVAGGLSGFFALFSFRK